LIFFTDSFLVSTKENQDFKKSFQYKSERNKSYRTKIRKLINALKSEEERLLQQEQKENEASVAMFERYFFLLLLAVGILLGATFFSIRYHFNKRIRAQQ
jgi:hypothetical protein